MDDDDESDLSKLSGISVEARLGGDDELFAPNDEPKKEYCDSRFENSESSSSTAPLDPPAAGVGDVAAAATIWSRVDIRSARLLSMPLTPLSSSSSSITLFDALGFTFAGCAARRGAPLGLGGGMSGRYKTMKLLTFVAITMLEETSN